MQIIYRSYDIWSDTKLRIIRRRGRLRPQAIVSVDNCICHSANLPFYVSYPRKQLTINKIIGWHIASMEANVPAYLTFYRNRCTR